MNAAPKQTFERSDVSGRAVVIFTIAFALVTALLIALLTLFITLAWRLPENPTQRLENMEVGTAGAPSLQVVPRADLEALMAEQHERLGSYGWIARENGIAHIPIEDAMRLTVGEPQGESER